MCQSQASQDATGVDQGAGRQRPCLLGVPLSGWARDSRARADWRGFQTYTRTGVQECPSGLVYASGYYSLLALAAGGKGQQFL